MKGGAVIDRCGFDRALHGSAPRCADGDEQYDSFLLPPTELRVHLARVFQQSQRSKSRSQIHQLLDGIAGTSQPFGLTVGASVQVKIALLYGIDVSLLLPTPGEILDEIRVNSSFPSVRAHFVAAAIWAQADVLACGQGANGATLEVLKLHNVRVRELEHECRIRAQK